MNRQLTRLVLSAVAAIALALTAGVAALGAIIDPGGRTGQLTRVGPVADYGFPTWYGDSNGVRLEGCVTLDDPLCAPAEVPNPDLPVSFPDNFPGELFYQLAGSSLTTTTGVDVSVGMDLEGAWATGEVIPGDQMVFNRIRIRADAPDGVTWRITHPYGVDQFTTEGGTGINMTQDIGTVPGSFGEALKGRVGPFLKWDPAVAPAAPAGYVGELGTLHPVVGSPYGTNFVRVEQQNADGSWTNLGETNLFDIQGRYATNSGVDVQKATYTSGSDGAGYLDVFATSEVAQSIQVSANAALGFPTTPMRGDGGRYYAHILLTGNVTKGTTIEVVNAGDKPVAKKTVTVADKIAVSAASYNGDTQELTVSATSSDAVVDGADTPVLTAKGFGDLTAGTATFAGVIAPPASVTVTSSHGGSTTVDLDTSGAGFVAGKPVAAFTAVSQAQVGQPVALDGTGSSGDITTYNWSDSGGPAGTFVGQGTAQATWTPSAEGTYTVTLTVTGPGGTSEPMSREIVVSAAAAVTANAGPDQVGVRRGQTNVTLDGSATTGQTSVLWSQVSGPAVTLSSATALKPTFTYPLMNMPSATPGALNTTYVPNNAPLVFQITATAGGVTSTDEVTVSPLAETFTGLTARYRTGRGEWRIAGTTSIKAGQNVTVVLGGTPQGRTIGRATVDATGAFAFRGGATPVPPNGTTLVTYVSQTGGVTTGVLTITP
jgi:hypothetical protein